MTVTDEDRKAADRHGYWLMDDELDDLAEDFARHRQAAYAAGLERAAVIAEGERLAEPQDESDAAYGRAIVDVVAAIRAERDKT